jgi:uncharacterized protein
MSLKVNLRHLEKGPQHLEGEMPAEELDLEGVDELIRVPGPLRYDLEAQKMEHAILVQGRLSLDLECDCVRCLKTFIHHLELRDFTCHILLEGDEKSVVTNDCVDLTPHLREDILLGFPRHPLCKPDCRGLTKPSNARKSKPRGAGDAKKHSPAWAELNKLKF